MHRFGLLSTSIKQCLHGNCSPARIYFFSNTGQSVVAIDWWAFKVIQSHSFVQQQYCNFQPLLSISLISVHFLLRHSITDFPFSHTDTDLRAHLLGHQMRRYRRAPNPIRYLQKHRSALPKSAPAHSNRKLAGVIDNDLLFHQSWPTFRQPGCSRLSLRDIKLLKAIYALT